MLGKPMYNYKDIVRFKADGVEKEGYIRIVDAYGTFGQTEEASYDIMVESENCLYKHIRESWIVGFGIEQEKRNREYEDMLREKWDTIKQEVQRMKVLLNEGTEREYRQMLYPLKMVTYKNRVLFLEHTETMPFPEFDTYKYRRLYQGYVNLIRRVIWDITKVKCEKIDLGVCNEECDYNFENFTVNEQNKNAYDAALDVVYGEREFQHLVLLFGPKGSGKTYLLKAIKQHIDEHDLEVMAGYSTAESLLSEVIQDMRSGYEKYTGKYKELFDVVLIDDIDFLPNASSAQKQILDILTTLQEQGKKVVVTSNKAPEELILDDELKKFLLQGEVIEIL